MDKDLRQQAIDLYDRFTHEGLDRRVFMARMVAIAGSAAASARGTPPMSEPMPLAAAS